MIVLKGHLLLCVKVLLPHLSKISRQEDGKMIKLVVLNLCKCISVCLCLKLVYITEQKVTGLPFHYVSPLSAKWK